MSEHEASFTEMYDQWCGKLNALGVPMNVWKQVLVEMYFPVDWKESPLAFRELAHEFETFGDRGRYDLTRPEGMPDHDYARGLLTQSQEIIDDRKIRLEAAFQEGIGHIPSEEEEDDSAVLEAYFTDLERRKGIN